MLSTRAKKAPASASSGKKVQKPDTANAETQQPASTSSDGAAPDRLSELEAQVERRQKELKELEEALTAERQRRLEATNKKKRDFTKFMNEPCPGFYPHKSAFVSCIKLYSEACFADLGPFLARRRRRYETLGAAVRLLGEQPITLIPFERFTQEEINALDELRDLMVEDFEVVCTLDDDDAIRPIHKRIMSMRDKVTDKH